MNSKFKLTARIRSFKYAFAGLWTLLKTQHNAWIHAVATALVIAAGICARLTPSKWCAIIFAIATVWIAEALNTAFEFLADAVHPQQHPLIKKAKDVAAAAVLIAAFAAVIVGAIVFLK
ncbi:MAG: diacylglycerol kinase family protein [Kiritimatiellaeota bacterium]|nr:diacylglycerol kinase family protein [Kiritimatiellota bacterium]